jgi:hypothetical protein
MPMFVMGDSGIMIAHRGKARACRKFQHKSQFEEMRKTDAIFAGRRWNDFLD